MIQEPKYRFFLAQNLGEALECCPVNWQEFQLAMSRTTFSVDREITSVLKFANEARDFLKTIYEANGDKSNCILYFYTRPNDWSSIDTTTPIVLKADFLSWDETYPYVSLRFYEQTLRETVEKNKSTVYEIPIPNYKSGVLDSEATVLDYTGVNIDKENRITAVIGDCQQLSGKDILRLSATRTSISPTTKLTFQTGIWVVANTAVSLDISYSIGNLVLEFPFLSTGRDTTDVRLVKIKSGGVFENIKVWTRASANLNFTNIKFVDTNVYSETISLAAGDAIAILVWSAKQASVASSKSCYLHTVLNEASAFQGYRIPVVSHEYLLEKVLEKITPTFTLQYNLPKKSTTTDWIGLSSGSGLYQAIEPKINVSLEQLNKSLMCLYGCEPRYDGTTIIYDYPSSQFQDTEAMVIPSISNLTTKYSDEHVYGTVVAGYDTDNDTTNCLLEFNCKNTFTVNTRSSKSLDLVHPFKASQFTIEKYLGNKSEETAKSDESDNSIFMFALNKVASQHTTLYRPTLTYSNLPVMSYNYTITPLHILIANGRYLGASLYKSLAQLVFASTERKADYSFVYGGNTYVMNDGGNAFLSAQLGNPLFLPLIADFESYMEYVEVDSSHANMYKYFTAYDKNSQKTYKVYINDLTLLLTGNNVQKWSTLIKEIV